MDDENEANAMEIYAAVKPRGDEPEMMGDPPELKARLHTFQRRSAAWMLHRENIPQVHSKRRRCLSRGIFPRGTNQQTHSCFQLRRKKSFHIFIRGSGFRVATYTLK